MTSWSTCRGIAPLIPPAIIRQVATLLDADPEAAIGTLATPVESLARSFWIPTP